MSDAVLARLRSALSASYLIERELGEGGAATVFLARDLRHERPVAIKVFKPELAETLGAERFTREIRTAANLQHPHILTVHDSGTADGLLYYVMPYVEGESLRARIEREGGLPITDAVRILREVADALSTAHAHGVVHRDIKPDNVLLSGRHALVADFGVAKAITEATGRNRVTTIGVALGTPAYMAPEQAAADPHIDHRVDIYALGVLGYEMLTGEPPFVRRTVQEVIAAHVVEPAPAVSARRPSVPPALDSLIAKCLAKQPADRWQSTDDIVAELERLATPTMGVTPTSATPAASRMGARDWRSKRMVIAAAGVLALLAAGWIGTAQRRGASAGDANLVAVLPFEFNATPDLAYLREGIVNVLETNLTGEGGPRAIASQTAIAQWKRRGGDTRGLTEEEARSIARELGAGNLLRGSIVGTAGNLILSATLVSSSPGGKAIQARVNGPSDSIASLTARLATQLLTLRVGEGAERTAALQSVPPPALLAYLEGQSHLRSARYPDAVRVFSRALAIDTTFALAGIAKSIAAGWSPTNFGNDAGLTVAFNNRDKLGPADLALLEMYVPSRFAGQPLAHRQVLDVRERLVNQIPDRVEAWYLLGDLYLHAGMAAGYSGEESRSRAENAFRRALALDPAIEFLKTHLIDLGQDPLDPARFRHLVDSIGAPAHHHALSLALRDGDSAAVRRLRAGFDSLSADQLGMAMYEAAYVGDASLVDELSMKAIERSGDESARRNIIRGARSVAWAMGRPAEAARMNDRLLRLSPRPELSVPADLVLAAVFADGDTVAAAAAAKRFAASADSAIAPDEATPPRQRAGAFYSGLWAAFREDTATLGAAIRRLDALGARRDSTGNAATGRLFADALRLVGDRATPARETTERVDAMLRDGPTVGTDLRAALNLIVARTFERLGDSRRAQTAATRASGPELMYVMGPVAQRDLGRVALAAGDTLTARRSWRMYLMSRAPEPRLRNADDEIRKRLEDLERAKR